MPTALDRLLARPSALRALRTIVHTPKLPRTWLPTTHHCCCNARRHRQFSSTAGSQLGHATQRAPADPHDATAWIKVLQHKGRLHGFKGVREVWYHMETSGFKMPVDDTPEARVLWGTLIKHSELMRHLLDHAAAIHAETGQMYARLYETCIEYWLPRDPFQALTFHRQLVLKLRLRRLPLRHLAKLVPSLAPDSLNAFMYMYRRSNERDIYDLVVPPLLAQGRVALARQWHFLCADRQDMPSSSVASHPGVLLFTADRATLPAPDRFPKPIGDLLMGTEFTDSDAHPKYDQRLLRRIQSRKLESVRFDDSFCARLFATRALPPATIMDGLVMVGVNEIGPEALRVLASRTDPITELPARFAELKKAGIAVRASIFSLALEKFTQQQDFALVQSMLDSDQHVDVFEDAEVQRELLDYYLRAQDWRQLHRTLAILTIFHNDSSTEAWNLILQAHIRVFSPHQVVQTVQTMRALKVMVSDEAFRAIVGCLPRRVRGHRPKDSKFDHLRFVTRLFIVILEGGIYPIAPFQWREILRRYGMTGRIRELRRVIAWLLSWYAPREAPEFSHLETPAFREAANTQLAQNHREHYHYFNLPPTLSTKHDNHPITVLFPRVFQHALITWGFRAGLSPNAPLEQSMLSGVASNPMYRRRFLRRAVLKRLHWSIGLRTLVQLRDQGVYVHVHTVVKALQMQFLNLFNHRRVSARIVNRMMRSANKLPYEHYVKTVNKIWGTDCKLFADEDARRRSAVSFYSWNPWMGRKSMHVQGVEHIEKIVGRRRWRRQHPVIREQGEVGMEASVVEEHSTQENEDEDDAPYKDPELTFEALQGANLERATTYLPYKPKKKQARAGKKTVVLRPDEPGMMPLMETQSANPSLDLLMRVSQSQNNGEDIRRKRKKTKTERKKAPDPIDPLVWAEQVEKNLEASADPERVIDESVNLGPPLRIRRPWSTHRPRDEGNAEWRRSLSDRLTEVERLMASSRGTEKRWGIRWEESKGPWRVVHKGYSKGKG